MPSVNQQQLSEDTPAGPGLGLKRPTFGLSRERINRLELVLAIRGGGVINVFDELDDEVTEERLETYSNELAEQIAAGKTRAFADSWTATGQRSWVNLGEVTAFTVRQAK
jgi:hypothetical protein